MLPALHAFLRRRQLFLLGLLFAVPAYASASEDAHGMAARLLALVVILLAARLTTLVVHIGQPPVLGELLAGIALGNLPLIGIDALEPIRDDGTIRFLAELGIIILLFQIGLESNVQKMRSIGMRASIVAIVGVILPLALGAWLVGPLLIPGQSATSYWMLGAALTATSVGITARIFKDLGAMQSKEAQIVLGAAVLDDVIGLIILAVMSAVATAGTVSAGTVIILSLKAAGFLVGSVVLGQLIAPWIGRFFSLIHTGVGMKLTLAVCFCLGLSGIALLLGLAPIVGAFAAGLALDPVHFRHFKNPHIIDDIKNAMRFSDPDTKREVDAIIDPLADKHIEDLVEPLSHVLVPIFFVVTGMSVDLSTLGDPWVIGVALLITIVACLGKIASGFLAGKGVNPMIVGWGMVPRGEVGLIFAAIGNDTGLISSELYSVLVLVVLLTTLFTPPMLSHLVRKQALRI
ncbi:MAG: cation:proton antiporter [Candidatus Peribacteraceae bacterium]